MIPRRMSSSKMSSVWKDVRAQTRSLGVRTGGQKATKQKEEAPADATVDINTIRCIPSTLCTYCERRFR